MVVTKTQRVKKAIHTDRLKQKMLKKQNVQLKKFLDKCRCDVLLYSDPKTKGMDDYLFAYCLVCNKVIHDDMLDGIFDNKEYKHYKDKYWLKVLDG